MKKVGIHQVNYFPWIGYFNKMAKSDVFIYLDEVQLTDRGYSQRAPVINIEGKASYLTVSVEKKGHRDKKFSEILLNQDFDWKEKQKNFLKGNYAKHSYYSETMELFEEILDRNYNTLLEMTLASVEAIKIRLGIDTKTVLQSSLVYDRSMKKSELMLELTKAISGEVYLSGNGARKYMDIGEFERENVKVQFQKFAPFSYSQYRQKQFVSSLSVLDIFFNMGFEGTKQLFWENLQNEEVVESVEV